MTRYARGCILCGQDLGDQDPIALRHFTTRHPDQIAELEQLLFCDCGARTRYIRADGMFAGRRGLVYHCDTCGLTWLVTMNPNMLGVAKPILIDGGQS